MKKYYKQRKYESQNRCGRCAEDKYLNLPGIEPRFSCRPLQQEIQTKTFVRNSFTSSRKGNNHPGDIRLSAHMSKFLITSSGKSRDGKVSKYSTTSLADMDMWQSSPFVRSRNNPQSTNSAGLELLYLLHGAESFL